MPSVNSVVNLHLLGLTKGIRIVALFEGAKGLLVLLVGFGLLELIHKDLHSAAVQIVTHLHLNPARHYPMIFIDAVNHLTDGQLWAMALSALLYSVVRFAEAVGLWLQRQWAAWFGLLTGGIYIPVEMFELTRGITWPKVIVLSVNAVIVAYLAHVLYRSRQQHKNHLS
jgi:uncharacterized membrane protein (DUF2068 family)